MRTTAACSCLDPIGIVGAVGCAIHCAAIPLVAATLPVSTPWFDNAFPSVSGIVGIWAFTSGWRRHRHLAPACAFALGMVLILLGRFLETHGMDGTALAPMVAGGMTIAGAHLANHRMRHRPARARSLSESRPA